MEAPIELFERLFKEYNSAIFRHLYYRLGNRERAKELTQEVFMKTWQHLIAQKTIEHEKAFLYRIANNVFINEIRTDKTTYSLDELEEETGYEPETLLPDPERTSEQEELMRFLPRLSPPYQEVLIMRFIDGLPVQEIAVLLGEKETNISMRTQRALAKLKEIYETRT